MISREVGKYFELQRRPATFRHAREWDNVAKACRAFAIPRASYYKWKKVCDIEEEAGLVRKQPIARKHPRAIPQETIDEVLELRTKYHLGPQRIVWYMERHHGIRIAFSSVYRILVRHGVSRFPTGIRCRALPTCTNPPETRGSTGRPWDSRSSTDRRNCVGPWAEWSDGNSRASIFPWRHAVTPKPATPMSTMHSSRSSDHNVPT